MMSIIALLGWSAITALHIAAEIYLRRYRLDVEDNLLARKHVHAGPRASAQSTASSS